VTEHLRVSGLYWGLTALTILGREDALPREEVIAFLLQCFHPSGKPPGAFSRMRPEWSNWCPRDSSGLAPPGGFSGNVHHDPHLLYTLSAVQVLVTYDALDRVDTGAIVRCTGSRAESAPAPALSLRLTPASHASPGCARGPRSSCRGAAAAGRLLCG